MKYIFLLFLPIFSWAQPFTPQDITRYKERAARVQVIIDDHGIPHIYGKSDADAVFGLMYVQAKQNFERVERNYLEVMGRLAEVEGESMVSNDLQMQLIYDTSAAKTDYDRSPKWLKELLHAFADGVNYYLHLNPAVKPKILKKFQPWFPLLYTDGSISATQTGGLTLADTRNLYFKNSQPSSYLKNHDLAGENLSGSNGFAIAPSKTVSGNSILYINPHVTFYFRTEVHMASEEGLNVYGAATWGNFFIYQGFNETCGWMHTSSYADVADLYEEKISSEGNENFYEYENQKRKVHSKPILLRYKKDGVMVDYPVTGFYTHHGPVMGLRNGKWLSLKERNRSMEALQQSWLRTKAKSFAQFKQTMQLRSNNSNNTVYADNQKNIAYWHGNFVPVRDQKYNWAFPVDGTIAATEWKGIHRLEETIHLLNPSSGWIQNCNSTPFTASGKSSPKKENYPEYMGPEGQNARALNAIRLLSRIEKADLDRIISIGYDTYLAGFAILLPALWDTSLHIKPVPEVAEAIQILREWDLYSSYNSIATTIAVEWGTMLLRKLPPAKSDRQSTNLVANFQWLAANVPGSEKITMLQKVLEDLIERYGNWRIGWGDINRFQRNPRSDNVHFSDSLWSIPSALASGTWGCLPSFNSTRFQNTKRRYGTSGNSFVAAVEFGKRIKAKTIMTGGESFRPGSIHFTDQAEGFLNGKFKEIRFYREDVMKYMERQFRPGQEGPDDL